MYRRKQHLLFHENSWSSWALLPQFRGDFSLLTVNFLGTTLVRLLVQVKLIRCYNRAWSLHVDTQLSTPKLHIKTTDRYKLQDLHITCFCWVLPKSVTSCHQPTNLQLPSHEGGYGRPHDEHSALQKKTKQVPCFFFRILRRASELGQGVGSGLLSMMVVWEFTLVL